MKLKNEVILILVVFVAFLFAGYANKNNNWEQHFFYQGTYAPAVMYSCGYDFKNPQTLGASTELHNFLSGYQRFFDCGEIPNPLETGNLTAFQSSQIYMQKFVGLIWKIAGLDWKAVEFVVAAIYALFGVSSYILMRQFFAWPCAVLGTALVAASSITSMYFNYLRDLSKAPFIIISVACMLYILLNQKSITKEISATVLMGVAIGLGLGFRFDLAAYIPGCMIAILLFYPNALNQSWIRRISIAILMPVIAGIIAAPVINSLGQGSNTAHVILLGLASPFDAALGISSGSYAFLPFYNDAYQLLQINAYWLAIGQDVPLAISSPQYEKAGFGLLSKYILTFPADLYLRLLAGIIQSMSFDYIKAINGWFGLFSIIVFIFGYAIKSIRLGLLLVFVVLFLHAQVGLQFHPRHFFHLVVIQMVGITYLLRLFILSIRNRSLFTLSSTHAKTLFLRNGVFSIIFVVGVLLCAWVPLQTIQASNLIIIQRNLLTTPVSWLDIDSTWRNAQTDLEVSRMLLVSARQEEIHDNLNLSDNRGFYAVFDVDSKKCSHPNFSARLLYKSVDEYHKFDRTINHWIEDRMRILIPIAEFSLLDHRKENDLKITGSDKLGSQLSSIIIDSEAVDCVVKIGITQPSDIVPFFMDWALPISEAHELRSYFPSYLSRSHPPAYNFSSSSEDIRFGRDELTIMHSQIYPLNLRSAISFDPHVEVSDKMVAMNGKVKSKHSYLIELDLAISDNELLLLRGHVATGGITVGLQKDGKWIKQAGTGTTGPFDLVLKSDPGEYKLVIANNLNKNGLNNFIINSIGILRQ
jgi:hypothetical protein